MNCVRPARCAFPPIVWAALLVGITPLRAAEIRWLVDGAKQAVEVHGLTREALERLGRSRPTETSLVVYAEPAAEAEAEKTALPPMAGGVRVANDVGVCIRALSRKRHPRCGRLRATCCSQAEGWVDSMLVFGALLAVVALIALAWLGRRQRGGGTDGGDWAVDGSRGSGNADCGGAGDGGGCDGGGGGD